MLQMITGLMSMLPEEMSSDISNMMMYMIPETVTSVANSWMPQFNIVLSSINVALDEILTSFGSKFFLKFDFSLSFIHFYLRLLSYEKDMYREVLNLKRKRIL